MWQSSIRLLVVLGLYRGVIYGDFNIIQEKRVQSRHVGVIIISRIQNKILYVSSQRRFFVSAKYRYLVVKGGTVVTLLEEIFNTASGSKDGIVVWVTVLPDTVVTIV